MFCYYIVIGFEMDVLLGETLKLVPIFFVLLFAALSKNDDLLVDLMCCCYWMLAY